MYENSSTFCTVFCLVGEKRPDKELPGIVGARGDTALDMGYYDAWLIWFCASHSSRVLSGDGLVGGNPTMNTPRLRRGGG